MILSDGLMDFKLNVTYVSEVVDWSKMLNVKNILYENLASVNLLFNWQKDYADINVYDSKLNEDNIPSDYNKKWADEF
jgi:hypothetical protein